MQVYDYSTRASREETVRLLLPYSVSAREAHDADWDRLLDYYSGHHRTQDEIAESCRQAGIPWISAACPDPYLHVESQIVPDLPAFVFHPRDPADAPKSAQREALVRFVLDDQSVPSLTALHERRCILYGTAVWKVFWDGSAVRVDSVDPRAVFPDPAASSLEDCEFVNFLYPMQRRMAERMYARELAARGLDISRMRDTFGDQDADSDTITFCEHWYRRRDGRVACSILAGGCELRSIPDYWAKTRYSGFPFVFQYRVRSGDSIWGSSDVLPALPLVDAVDRELAQAQLSAAFSGSDVILAEQDAFASPPENRPGAVWNLRPGAMEKVRRLGGLEDRADRLAMIDRLREMIQDTVGNYDIGMGKEPTRTLSATGLAQLIERSETRRASKKHERMRAYAALFRLIDWTVLEFYEDGQVIRLGAAGSGVVYRFSGADFADARGYFPGIDCEVSAVDALQSSRTMLLSMLESLMGHTITRENYPLAAAALSMLDSDQGRALRGHLEKLFGAAAVDASAEAAEEIPHAGENDEVKGEEQA